jgi:tRNA pseudouridine32 synthase
MGDHIEHLLHRHEPPVLAENLTILENIHENPLSDLVAVNKPPSIPVHPCGRYNYNSLTFILSFPPYSYENLHGLFFF